MSRYGRSTAERTGSTSIAPRWKELLRPASYLAFEIGETQADDVIKLMRLAGFKSVECDRDTAGHDRVVSGRL